MSSDALMAAVFIVLLLWPELVVTPLLLIGYALHLFGEGFERAALWICKTHKSRAAQKDST